jgi:hypothetical protein
MPWRVSRVLLLSRHESQRLFRPIFAGKAPLLRGLWQAQFPYAIFGCKTRALPVTKTSKTGLWAFPKQAGVDTYASHPMASARVAFSGSLRTGSIGANGVHRDRFGTGIS